MSVSRPVSSREFNISVKQYKPMYKTNRTTITIAVPAITARAIVADLYAAETEFELLSGVDVDDGPTCTHIHTLSSLESLLTVRGVLSRLPQNLSLT